MLCTISNLCHTREKGKRVFGCVPFSHNQNFSDLYMSLPNAHPRCVCASAPRLHGVAVVSLSGGVEQGCVIEGFNCRHQGRSIINGRHRVRVDRCFWSRVDDQHLVEAVCVTVQRTHCVAREPASSLAKHSRHTDACCCMCMRTCIRS